MTTAASFEDFITALPKVELHVHLEGSMQPATLLALADKHQVSDLQRSLAEIRSWYEFRDFPHFLEVYRNAVRVLCDEDDFALLAAETVRTLARQNVRYAEVNFSLCDHLKRGIPAEVVFAGLEQGRKQVETEHDIIIRWVPDFAGDYGVAAGQTTLDAVLAHGPASVLGFSIGGLEVDRDPFADLFTRARAHGLRSLPHAGETEGPERVWSAIHALGAERIGHGIGSVRDAALVDYLREQQLPLDVSPTSNLCTRSVPSLVEHPLPRMLDTGLLVTLNSDDPPMFGTDLTGEYRTAAQIGEALVRVLRDQGHEVVGLDVDSSPCTTVVGSITDREVVRECLRGVDTVLHAATLHKPHVGSHDQQAFIDTNITGTLVLLEEAVAAGVARFVFTSTTSTFGHALTPAAGAPAAWITEDVTSIPKNIYGVTKTAAENLCELIHREHGLPTVVLRTARFFPELDDHDDTRARYADANVKANEYLYRRVDLADVVDAHLLAAQRAPQLGFGRYIISATTPVRPRRSRRARPGRGCRGASSVSGGGPGILPAGLDAVPAARPRLRQRTRPHRAGLETPLRLPPRPRPPRQRR